MKLKQIPEDFLVNEIYDLDSFKEKEEKGRVYDYFILTKKNYPQIKAIEKVARIFNVSRKFVHFAGTKDRVGITTQIISIFGIKEGNFEKNLDYFNESDKDLKLESVGRFNGRINLGDNLGNSFEITIRDIGEGEVEKAKNNLENISRNGVLNFFDEQRFGYANNSHIIGKFILKNEVENAVKEILLSLPKNPKEEHKDFAEKIKSNWDKIKNQDLVFIEELINECPQFLRDERNILFHLKKFKNDFPGAFRTINKKIRTLYVNAYQSYVFNELIKDNNINSLELELVHSEIDIKTEMGEKIEKILSDDGLGLENFKLKSMPELKISQVFRKVRNYPKDLKIVSTGEDELNLGKRKMVVTFKLGSGEYATNVVKQLFT